MAIEKPKSDTERGIHHEPNMDYPVSVTVQLMWMVGGNAVYHTIDIPSDRFFGYGQYGAPIEGAALIGMIENARRAGPYIPPPQKRKANAKAKR
jgi:hypothetical protein